jgi:hypothetical protein
VKPFPGGEDDLIPLLFEIPAQMPCVFEMVTRGYPVVEEQDLQDISHLTAAR